MSQTIFLNVRAADRAEPTGHCSSLDITIHTDFRVSGTLGFLHQDHAVCIHPLWWSYWKLGSTKKALIQEREKDQGSGQNESHMAEKKRNSQDSC